MSVCEISFKLKKNWINYIRGKNLYSLPVGNITKHIIERGKEFAVITCRKMSFINVFGTIYKNGLSYFVIFLFQILNLCLILYFIS